MKLIKPCILFVILTFSCFTVKSQGVPNYVPSSGLVGWWPFTGNVIDSSGNGNNGSINGGVTSTTDRFGRNNSAYLFNGTNGNISISSLDSMPYRPITYSFWTKVNTYFPTSNGHKFKAIIGRNTAFVVDNGVLGFWADANYSGGAFDNTFLMWRGGWTSGTIPNTSSTPPLNTWIHLVYTHDSNGDWKWYQNGNLVNSGNFTNSQNDFNYFQIGGCNNQSNGNSFWNDKIDDVGIWKRALTDCEIKQLYLSQYYATPTLNIGKDTIRICKADSLKLTANNGFASYSWSTGATSKSIYKKTNGKVVITATDSFGCKVKDSAIVSILNPKIAPRDTVVCKGAQVTLRSTIKNNSSVNISCGYMPNALKTGMVAWYPFCGNANDGSGNGNNGTVNGATSTLDRFGNVNSAYSFNGSSDYIQISLASIANRINSNTSFTSSVWVKTSDNHGPVISMQGAGGIEYDFHIGTLADIVQSAGNYGILVRDNCCGTGNNIFGSSVVNNAWHMLTIVRTANGTIKCYKDGVLEATSSASSSGQLQFTAPYLNIGADRAWVVGSSQGCNSCNSNNQQHLNGLIDDVGLWTRELSSSEISQLYTIQNQSSTALIWSTSDTTSTTKITANSDAKVWLKATDGIGTCYDTTNVYERNTTLDIGKDTIRSCKLDSLQLSGNNGFVSYTWSTGASSKSTYIKSTGKVVLTAIDSFGCKAKDSAIVSVLNPKIAPRDTVVCKGAQVTLRSTINNNSSVNSTCGFMPNALKTGLVGWYPFCGNANDVSGNGNNGTVNGATLTTDRNGFFNSAYSFDGINDYIQTSGNGPTGTGISVSYWFKSSQTSSYASIIAFGGNSSGSRFEVLHDYWAAGTGPCIGPSIHGSFTLFAPGMNSSPNNGQWHHAVVILPTNASSLNQTIFYVDGIQLSGSCSYANYGAPSPSIGSGNTIKFGMVHTNMGANFYDGILDDIGIWNRVLSNAEIAQLHTFQSSSTKLTWSTSDTTSTTKITANANTKIWLKATDGIGTCYDTTNVYVSNPQLNVVNDTLKFTACNRDSLMLNVGSKWSSTQWSNGSKDSSIYLKTTGKYKVMVKDQYGCSASDSTYFINPGKPKINTLLADSVNCFAGNDGSITSLYSGGYTPYTFFWNDASKQTSSNAYNLNKGAYKLVLKDAYGCKDSLTANVYEPLKLSSSISFNDSVNCYGGNDGSLQVNVSGGVKNYQYLWNDANQQNTAKASNLKQGSYKVLISDYYNCKDSITAVVSEPAKLQTSLVYADSVNCFGGNDGSIKINVVGGVKNYKFLWSDMQTTQNANNLKKGTYSVLVTDYYNCKDSVSVAINEPLKLQVSLLSNDSVNCFGGSDGNLKINVVGGVKNYKFLWSDNQTTQDAINLKKGTYKVMVSDYYNCKDSLSSIIEEPAKLQVSLVSTDSVNCYAGNDGSININVVGGVKNYSFLWNDNQSTQNATGLKKGLYKVIVNDYYQCKDSLNASIFEPAKLVVSLLSVDSVNCFSGNDGSIQVNIIGGVKNYKTVWNDPNKQNTLKASNLKKGLYKVMVSDFYNCKDSLTVKVDEPAKLTASIVLVDSVNCFGGKDGKIQVSVAGGVKNYNYVWNDASKQKTALASNLQKGSYKVLVTDYYACKDSATASVMEPNKLIASINYVDSVNCFGGSDGSITTSISGGVKTYKYIWSDNQKTQNAYNLKKGNYKLIVSDYYNCKDSATATVYEPLKLVVSVVSTDSVNCYGGNDGSIKIKAVGGNNGYSYLWNDINKQKTPLASNLTKGLYKVSVKDIYGCSDSLTANVFEPAKVVLKIQSFRNASCFGYNDGSALASASGGTGAYKYSWNTSPVQSGNTAIGLRKGSYKATVLDAYGCSDTVRVVIAEPQQIVPKISGNRLAVRDILHELSSTVTPLQKYTYNWTPSTVFGKPSNLASIKGKFYSTTLVTLRTTDATSCFGEDTATITVFIPFSDFIPTVFSPNGDSHNDVFGLPDYFEITQFDVYNRWGALLFRGSTSNPTWDGIYEGKLVPLGTYMYIIKAKLKGTVYEFEHQGTVTVLR